MIDDDEKIITTHIPALPGWKVGTAHVGDDDIACGVWWEPVIAWVVRTSEMKGEATHNWVDPISIGMVGQGERYVLMSPGGVIYEPENGSHASDSDVVSQWREQDIRAKQRRDAKAAK